MNAEVAAAPSAEVSVERPKESATTAPPWGQSSTALLVGPSIFAGSYVSTTPGIVAGIQYRTAGAHAFVLGPRGGVHFPGKYTGTSAFGTLGLELGYRGNFLAPSETQAGLLATVTPSVGIGIGRSTALLVPFAVGGFLRFGALEFQLTVAAGMGLAPGGPGPFGAATLLGGYVF
ncbi:MAG: hypothetical protein U0174_22885 [Polyangiaceae bacterium]